MVSEILVNLGSDNSVCLIGAEILRESILTYSTEPQENIFKEIGTKPLSFNNKHLKMLFVKLWLFCLSLKDM